MITCLVFPSAVPTPTARCAWLWRSTNSCGVSPPNWCARRSSSTGSPTACFVGFCWFCFYLPAAFWWFSGSRVSFLWVVWSENLGKHFGKEQQLCYYVLSLLQLRSGDQRERFHFTRDRKKRGRKKKGQKLGERLGNSLGKRVLFFF